MNKLLFIFLLLFTISCTTENTSPNKENSIVNAAISKHGGLDYWKSVETLDFRKKTILLLEDGSIERQSDERHTLHQRDTLHGQIVSLDTSQVYTIQFADGVGKKIANRKTSDGTNAFLASHFVVNQPFKMLDPEVELSYLGLDTLEQGQVVDVVKAYYGSPDDDVWWFYFDKESHILLATLIYHAPTYAYVVNDKIEEIDGLLWNTKRTTYRTDSLRNKQFVRAKFEYLEIGEH